MNICLFTADEINQPLSSQDPRGEHILKILHKNVGDTFTAGIIGGKAGKATIRKITQTEKNSADGKKSFKVSLIEFSFQEETDGKPLYPLKMIIGFPRPIQLKRLLRDMAGLGVSEVHLCGTELGEKSYLKSDLATTDAGFQMLLEGTQQAASTHVPLLKIHSTLEDAISAATQSTSSSNYPSASSSTYPSGSSSNYPSGSSSNVEKSQLLCLDNINPTSSLNDFMSSQTNLHEQTFVACIGSERGWTENERKLMEQKGFIRLSMGSRVLRTETASTVAASIILGSAGYLN